MAAEIEITEADRAYVQGLFPEVNGISDPELRGKVVDIWVETWRRSGWERIEDVPKNPETVGLRRNLVSHVRAVTAGALGIARAVGEFHGLRVNTDLLIAGCLLHDVSKLLEYEPRGEGAGKSALGRLIQHAVYGVHMAIKYGLPLELAHIINSHTAESRLAPRTLEAVIIYYADYADSDVLLLEAGRPLLLSAAR